MALAVAMILMAIGLPVFLRAYRTYQLSNAASQVAGILRLTRYEAIRLNTQVNCLFQVSPLGPGMTQIWADTIKNGNLDPTEKMVLLGSGGNLVDSGGVPGTAALIASANLTLAATPEPPLGAVITFDARGAVVPPTTVDVFYLGSALAPDAGYRAVLLMPAGSIQIWTADSTGAWQQLR